MAFSPVKSAEKKKRLLSPELSEPVEETDVFLHG